MRVKKKMKPIFSFLREKQWPFDDGGTTRVDIDKDTSIVMTFDNWTFRVEPEGKCTTGCEIDWPKDTLYDRYAVLTCAHPTTHVSLSLYKQDAQSRQVVGSWSFKLRIRDE